jgi:hypothetical protein
MFKLDPEIVGGALAYTSLGLLVVVFIVVLAGILLAMLSSDVEFEDQCAARHEHDRCVHGKDHPGSHRDRAGNYWN